MRLLFPSLYIFDTCSTTGPTVNCYDVSFLLSLPLANTSPQGQMKFYNPSKFLSWLFLTFTLTCEIHVTSKVRLLSKSSDKTI